MAETLDTIAEKITALSTRFDGVDTRLDGLDARFDSVDARFDGVDTRFDGVVMRFEGLDQQLVELKSGLRTQIEAVDAKVGLVLEKVTDLITRDARHSVVHARFDERFEDHEVRLIAVESSRAPSAKTSDE